jgi:RNA polymerase sigma factor (sigma-70 family)
MSSDGTLLKRYAESGSEDAFAELVRRHLDFVYSTALRSVGRDEQMAKDVTQVVFMDLARKADRLSRRSILTGWLYTSTCFAAATAVRSERRRKIREQEAHRMQDEIAEPFPNPDWEQIGPILNSLMLELKAADQEILLLRFFERRSLAAVGNEIGLTENGARMRVQRALDRLHERLTRRGITSSTAALALMLTNQTIVAAPAGLAASVTTASLAGAATSGGTSILHLILMSKTKSIIIGAAITAGAMTPIVVQHRANSHLKTEIETLQARLAERPESQPTSVAMEELDRLRGEHQELVRLRGDVATLRQQIASESKSDLRKSDDRNRAIKQAARIDEEAEQAKALLAKSPEIPMIPASSWVNAGNATPASSVQTAEWATVNRDTNALLKSVGLEPEARALAEEIYAGLPQSIRDKYGSVDAILVEWRLKLDNSTVAYRVLSQTEEGANDATLVIQRQYADGRVRENSTQFYRDEAGGWRLVMPPGVMAKLPAVINSLAEASTSPGQ